MGKFDNQVVFITGGARGQGRSHALAFAREGADIVVCDSVAPIDTVPYRMPRKGELEETARQVGELGKRCIAVEVDVRDPSGLTSLVERSLDELGRIDVCLANAGVATYGAIAEMEVDKWQTMVDINLTGVFHTLRAVLPAMIGQKSGRIVVTSSMTGKLGIPNAGHYAATKWGVIGLVKSVAQEVAANGITVNAVCPTAVDTPMIQNDATYRLFMPGHDNPTAEDAVEAFRGLNSIPVPWVEVEDVSNAMLFLCSKEARYITGETIAVAAGQNASNAG